MKVPNIVRGQPVDDTKAIQARKLRREMTPAERILWARLRQNRLQGIHFRRQQVIAGFIVDFYCHAAAVVVELDGAVHEGHEDYDAERDRVLSERGFIILRFGNQRVQTELPTVLAEIATVCRGRQS
jgi:very-short-patch-repair endonuclease